MSSRGRCSHIHIKAGPSTRESFLLNFSAYLDSSLLISGISHATNFRVTLITLDIQSKYCFSSIDGTLLYSSQKRSYRYKHWPLKFEAKTVKNQAFIRSTDQTPWTLVILLPSNFTNPPHFFILASINFVTTTTY